MSYVFVNLADSGEIKRNGDIVFTSGNTFYNVLLSYPIMPYPNQLQMLNSKWNPNSFYLLRKIAEHKNMNAGKKNEDVIAVKFDVNEAKKSQRNRGCRSKKPQQYGWQLS